MPNGKMQQHQNHLDHTVPTEQLLLHDEGTNCNTSRQGASQNKQEHEQQAPRSPLILQQYDEKWKTAEKDDPSSKKNHKQDSHSTDTICSKQQQEEDLNFPSLVVAAAPFSAMPSTTTTARALVLPVVLSSSIPLLNSSSFTAAATICNATTTSCITSGTPGTPDASKKMTSRTTSDATVAGDRIVNNTNNRRITKNRKMGAAVPDTLSSCATVAGSKVLEPSIHDVLKGRGEGLYNHEGNRFYRWIIKENAFAYLTATKRKMKSGTISEIYLTIQKRGGRFLILNEELNLWYEMSEVEAKRKISQSLRDEKKKKRTNSSISVVFKNGGAVATDDDEQNNEEDTKMLDNYQHAGSSYLLPPPPLKCGVTTSSSEQATKGSHGRGREEGPIYGPAPLSLMMPVLPALESSHSNVPRIRTHCNPSTYIDAPKKHDNKTTCTPMNNNAPAATNVTLFEQSLSPLKFYYNLNTTSSRTSNHDEYSSFDVQEGPPMLLPAGPASQSMCPEGVKKGQRLDFTRSALLQQQEPSSLSEKNIDGMKQEEQRSSKSTIMLQDDDNQEESPRCPENTEVSTYRLFEEDESPININGGQFVPNPHLFFLSSQQENEQHHHQQQQQQQQQKQHELEQESNDEIGLKLGDLHVRKYFPQDWERLLPSGWEDWDISLWQKIHSLPSLDNMLPTYFWHSIPRQLTSIVESPFGKVIPAPVETVLDPNGNLGSCWKMAGRNGRMTFRLKRPVVMESITIDHYPWLSSAHNPDDFRNHVTSAPRFMRVIGYPPCDDDNVECQEQIGFDAERSIYMNSFEYKVDASRWNDGDLDEGNLPINSSQTFQLSTVNVLPEDDDDDNDDDFEDDAEEKIPTCDAVKATSCHGKFTQTIDDSQKLLAALTLTIDVNWGNPNYTCLYRVRVNERK